MSFKYGGWCGKCAMFHRVSPLDGKFQYGLALTQESWQISNRYLQELINPVFPLVLIMKG